MKFRLQSARPLAQGHLASQLYQKKKYPLASQGLCHLSAFLFPALTVRTPWGLCQSAAPFSPKGDSPSADLCYFQQHKSSSRLEPAHIHQQMCRKPVSSWIGAEGHRASSYQPPKATTARRSHCRALSTGCDFPMPRITRAKRSTG